MSLDSPDRGCFLGWSNLLALTWLPTPQLDYDKTLVRYTKTSARLVASQLSPTDYSCRYWRKFRDLPLLSFSNLACQASSSASMLPFHGSRLNVKHRSRPISAQPRCSTFSAHEALHVAYCSSIDWIALSNWSWQWDSEYVGVAIGC